MSNSKSTYRTIKDSSTGLYKEKGSKFIGIAVSCYTENEAKNYLEEWKKEHHQARHVCYAYRFGVDQKIFRANDDGEPNNSAGAPILGQIQSYDLTNVLIGVVRYFGGTKLGVGGLIHAYRSAAREAIENGEIEEKEVFEWIQITFDYESLPEIMNVLKQYQLLMKDQVFETKCILTTNLPLNKREIILAALTKNENATVKSFGIY